MTQTQTLPSPAEAPTFAALFAAEEKHFWFRGRNQVIGKVFEQLTRKLRPGYRVLEVGCGNGNVLRKLEEVCRRGEVTGLELHEEGLRHARQRTRCRLMHGDLHQLDFPAALDLLGMFDVLEHLPDDHRALTCLRRAMAPNGRIVLTVPAHLALWSHVDECAGHYRRYSPARLRGVLEASGFQVEYLTQFMLPLAPLMWAARRLAALLNRFSLKPKKDARALALEELKIVPVLNPFLTWLLEREVSWIARRKALPLGSSLLAIARNGAAVEAEQVAA
jgi:SAM-dependent methyltransferase